MMHSNEVIERARLILQDAKADYWQQDELPKWLTDARQECYVLRPDLYLVNEERYLNEGSRQSYFSGKELFRVVRNVSHPKQREVTPVQASVLARHRPNWRIMKPSIEILHYMVEPTHFDVYPPAAENVYVEVQYAKIPNAIYSADSGVSLDEEGEYAQALVDYVVYRAFLKEADTTPAFHDRAAAHYAKFKSALGVATPSPVVQN